MISIIPCIRKVNRLGRSTCFGFRQKAQSNIKLPRSGSSLSRYLVDWRHSFFSLLGFQSYCSWLSIYSLGRRWHPLRLAEDFATADILTGGRIRLWRRLRLPHARGGNVRFSAA